jgi:hypothetical protein
VPDENATNQSEEMLTGTRYWQFIFRFSAECHLFQVFCDQNRLTANWVINPTCHIRKLMRGLRELIRLMRSGDDDFVFSTQLDQSFHDLNPFFALNSQFTFDTSKIPDCYAQCGHEWIAET